MTRLPPYPEPDPWYAEHDTPAAELPSFDAVAPVVEAQLSSQRFDHVLRVVDGAEKLAVAYEVPPAEVRLAALLHDVLRERPVDELLEMAADRDLLGRDPSLAAFPLVLHGPVAALWSRARWPELPASVLGGIAHHVVGHPQMGLVAQIVFVADYTEPGRTFPSADVARRRARESLAAAIVAAAEGTIRYLLERREPIHPRLLETRNAFLRRHRIGGGTA